MNTPTEESNLSLFKYAPEITSQFLIQTNDSQITNICEDLLLTELDGTGAWNLPVLLNSQNDSQTLCNQISEEPVASLTHSDETLSDILDQGASGDQFIETNVENSQEINYPLAISDKNFLTDNNLFVMNEVIDGQVDASANCDLIRTNHEILGTEITNGDVFEESSESIIQSSDISSQEAFTDIKRLLSYDQSVLNMNCPDLIFNIQEPQNSLNNDLDHQNARLSSIISSSKDDPASDILQNFTEETDKDDNNLIDNIENPVLSYDESMNSLIQVMNVNMEEAPFASKEISNDQDAPDELETSEIPIDDEPDSTVTDENDLEDSLNIDDLATIITAYQCKKCDFTCNDKNEFLIHFKDAHIQNQIYEVPPSCLIENSLDKLQNILESDDSNQECKRLKLSENNNIPTVNILCTNGEITTITPGIIVENNSLDETNVTNSKEYNFRIENIVNLEENYDQSDNIENGIKITDVQPTDVVFTNENLPSIKIVSDPEIEKKIMRVRNRKKKSKKPKVPSISEEPSGVTQLLILSGENENNITLHVNDDLIASSENLETEKHLIYLCSQCAEQFLTVEDCRAHMMEVHKLCATESDEKDHFSPEENSQPAKDSQQITVEDKNKRIIEKILGEDTLKTRRHKCSVKGCPYRFAKPELLTRHETCHVDRNRSKFFCPECKELQTSWRACSIHLWRCHQLDLDLYACPLCNYKGSTALKLRNHIKIHSDDREYVCPDCGNKFKQASQLRNHRVIHLDIHPPWYSQKYCDKCEKFFADSKCLKKHIQTVHSKLKPFICNICGHCCARKAMLRMHLRQHTGEKPFSCSVCLFKTGDHNSLRRHKMRHSGARQYKCPHCEYTAIQSHNFIYHLARKHPGMSGAYSCKECTFKTVNEETYMSHMIAHKSNTIDSTPKPAKRNAKIKLVSLFDVLSNSSSNLSGTKENEIFSGSGGSGQLNITTKENIDLEDDETQNCFMSLINVTDEQTVDTGGITIPADPDDPEPLNM